jgi:PAS domain S-box-containing protein
MEATPERSDWENPDPIRVLHVDDDPAFARVTAAHLERGHDGFAVKTARAPSEGLGRLAQGNFDCVVSDYSMPEQNGIEFLETVREAHPELPFILFTGKGSEEVASEAISAGVTDYLQKSLGAEQYAILANRIRNAVDRATARRERRRHLDAIETAREGISILDEDGRFVYVNRAYADVFGYDPEEMLGEHWALNYDEEGAREVAEEVVPVLEEEGYWRGETTGTRADGSTITVDHTLAITDNGEYVCTVRDITDRKERERRFEAIFNNTYTFVGLLDPDGTVLEANETALEFGGLSREEVVGEPVWETYWFQSSEEARATAREAVERARDGELYWDQIRVQGDDCEAIVDFTVRPVTDEDGTVTALVPEGRDVTARKRREQRLETLVDEFPGVVYWCRTEPGWPVERIGGEVEELTGYPARALESRDGLLHGELVRPEDRDEVRDAVESAATTGDSFELTYRIRTRDGATRWVWERGHRVPSVEGGSGLIVGFITDVTDQQETARELRREREFVQQALDTLDDLFYVVGADGELIRWNERVSEVTGYTDEEIDGMQAVEFFPDDERDRVGEAIEETLTTGRAVLEAELLTADGDRVPYEFTGRRLSTVGTDMVGLVGVGRDVQARRRRERELERKNEQLDEFVRIASHDLRSPLSVASGRLDLAREECDSEHLETAADAVERSRALVEDLLTLARKGDREDALKPVSLAELVETCWRTVETGEATLVVDTDRRIRADRSRLRQLLENLLRNAVEHGSTGSRAQSGDVAEGTSANDQRPSGADDAVERGGGGVTVRVGDLDDGFYVEDDGPGISEEERERVFEPGYSTAEAGTGFGLHIVGQIVEQHGCEISVTEGSAGGARFEITGFEFAD